MAASPVIALREAHEGGGVTMHQRPVLVARRDFAPDVSPAWPSEDDGEPVALSAEPFGGLLRSSYQAPEPRSRRGLIGAGLALAAVLAAGSGWAVNRYGMPNLGGTAVAAKVAEARPLPPSPPSSAATSAEIAEGIKALRSQLQAAQNPVAPSRVNLASADEPGAISLPGMAVNRPAAAPAPVQAPVAVSVPAAPAAVPAASAVLPEPSPPAAVAHGPSAEEVQGLIARAKAFIRLGDIAAARRVLEYAASGENGDGLFALAETFDPGVLSGWHVRGVRGDVERARALYNRASSQGVDGAQARLAALR